MAGSTITYVDHPVNGSLDSTGNLPVLTDVDALNNAITQWLLSFDTDFIRSGSGGILVPYLDKTMDEETASNIKTAIIVGFAKDFTPNVQVQGVEVIPDYDNDTWNITIVGYCSSLKSIVNYSNSFKSLG